MLSILHMMMENDQQHREERRQREEMECRQREERERLEEESRRHDEDAETTRAVFANSETVHQEIDEDRRDRTAEVERRGGEKKKRGEFGMHRPRKKDRCF